MSYKAPRINYQDCLLLHNHRSSEEFSLETAQKKWTGIRASKNCKVVKFLWISHPPSLTINTYVVNAEKINFRNPLIHLHTDTFWDILIYVSIPLEQGWHVRNKLYKSCCSKRVLNSRKKQLTCFYNVLRG